MDNLLRSGAGIVAVGLCLVLAGCARELTPYGRARQADTIPAYEEFIRNNPRDPRARYARQRIESLRLLEAKRSGSLGEAGAVSLPPREGITDSAATRDMTPVTGLPRASTFILDLNYGDAPPIPHRLTITQRGEVVSYTLEHGNESNKSFLAEHIPVAYFSRFWGAVVSADIGSMRPSYGRMTSAADYRGYLVIEIDTGTGKFSKRIRLEGLSFQDERLRNLLNSMTQMHPRDHRMPLFQ